MKYHETARTDLFKLEGLEPPAGDLGIRPAFSSCRAIWTTPIAGEDTAPAHRIIHARTLRLHASAKLERLGVQRAPGYHKCGSLMELDWVAAFRVLLWNGKSWKVHLYQQDLPHPAHDEVQWFDLGGIETAAAIFEIRQCGIDPWWPSWNLASGAFILEGTPPKEKPLRGERALNVEKIAVGRLPSGLSAFHENGEVRFRSKYLEVGFRLRRAGFSYLALDDEGLGRTEKNLLKMNPGISFQGLFLHPVGAGPTMAPSIRYDVKGSTTVEGNVVTYEIDAKQVGQRYRLQWKILPDRLCLSAARIGASDCRAWESSAWTMGLDARVSATTGLGLITRQGESGTMHLPVFFHAPAFGSLEITSHQGEAFWRVDSFRPADLAIHQLKLGELPQPEGDYLLRAGRHEVELEMVAKQLRQPLQSNTPPEVARALNRCLPTSLSFRPDTATYSNNGNSMHCPICMDNWSALSTRIGEIMPGVSAMDMLRDSIERWLDGGPGYASGGMLVDGDMHLAEDEYIMTGTAALLGTAEFLEHSGEPEWLRRFEKQLARQLKLMRERDLDNDGLVESKYRLGISGQYQWSTCFFDVISFGWKCAFSNALLYPALIKFSQVLPQLGFASLAHGLEEWAKKLRANYYCTFYNEKTGWLAGWRCKNDELHDHTFITVNGAAISCGLIDEAPAKEIMSRLWEEAKRVGMPDPALGVPTTLWPIPDDDLAEIQHGFPFGYYGNGGLSTAQARHLVNALYKVGMLEEADYILKRICKSLGEAFVFGGAKSGVDARSWDGWPCGYEGLLTDQFGILATALDRYQLK